MLILRPSRGQVRGKEHGLSKYCFGQKGGIILTYIYIYIIFIKKKQTFDHGDRPLVLFGVFPCSYEPEYCCDTCYIQSYRITYIIYIYIYTRFKCHRSCRTTFQNAAFPSNPLFLHPFLVQFPKSSKKSTTYICIYIIPYIIYNIHYIYIYYMSCEPYLLHNAIGGVFLPRSPVP